MRRASLRLRIVVGITAAASVFAAAGCSPMNAYRARVNAEEVFARGAEAIGRHDLEAADRDFTEAVRLAPDSASLQARIGMAYMGTVGWSGRIAESWAAMRPTQAARALPYFERALALDPRQPPVAYLQALLAGAKLRRDGWARGVLSQAARQFRDDAAALNDIGYTLVDADVLTTDALPLLRRAVRLEPASGMIVDSLGWAYYRLGDLTQAARFLEQAVSLEPRDAEIGYHLGAAYAALGRITDARRQFRRALASKPGLEPARSALRALGPD